MRMAQTKNARKYEMRPGWQQHQCDGGDADGHHDDAVHGQRSIRPGGVEHVLLPQQGEAEENLPHGHVIAG